MSRDNTKKRGNYNSGEDYVLEYGELRFTFNEEDFRQRVEQAAVKLSFVKPGLATEELDDLVNLAVNGEIREASSPLGEHVNERWYELVGPADRSLVHWLRRLVFRGAWLDQRVKEGELDIHFHEDTHSFGYVQPDRDSELIELSPEPSLEAGRVSRARPRTPCGAGVDTTEASPDFRLAAEIAGAPYYRRFSGPFGQEVPGLFGIQRAGHAAHVLQRAAAVLARAARPRPSVRERVGVDRRVLAARGQLGAEPHDHVRAVLERLVHELVEGRLGLHARGAISVSEPRPGAAVPRRREPALGRLHGLGRGRRVSP